MALASALFRIGALRFGRFTFPGEKTSSYYLDLRIVPSDPEAYGLAVAAFKAMIASVGENSFDAIVGVATVGVAFASPLAHFLKKPLLGTRIEGKEWLVEGAARPRWRTLMIGDLVATGKTVSSSADALRKRGCAVRDAIVLVDRQEGARASLAASGVKLNSFINVSDLVEVLFENKSITKANYQAVLKQMEGSQG